MATYHDFLSEDQLYCSICLDIFTEPVSTPCGHTFCQDCLTRHCTGKFGSQCPLCNNKINKDLKLSVNTTFRDVVDSFKKHHDITSPAKPGDVSCDLCPLNKIRASKTCMVCLVSFCETHLEPHLRVAALQRHKLSNPVPNLEERICREHNQMLEFCLDDHMLVCALCTEHRDHDRVNLNETYMDQRSHIWRRTGNIQQTKKNKRNGKAQCKKKSKNEREEGMKANQMTESDCQPYHKKAPSHSKPYKCNPKNKDFSKLRETWDFNVSRHIGFDLAIFRESDFERMPFLQNWGRHCILRFRVRRKTKRLQLFVDYGNGLVLLYDPDNEILLHRFTGCGISEKIFPCFVPSQSDLIKWVQSLRTKVQKMSDFEIFDWCLWFFAITLTSICILHFLLIS